MAAGTTPSIPNWAQSVVRAFNALSAFSIVALMGLVFLSVFFRYVLGQPIIATEDMTAILLGVVIFTAFPSVTLGRRHISVDLLAAPFKRFPGVDRIRLIVIDIGIVLMTVFYAYHLYIQAVRFFERETGTLMMDWPWWPFVAIYVVLVLLGGALFAARALRDKGRHGDDDGGLSL